MIPAALLGVCATAEVFTFAGGTSSDLLKSVSGFLSAPTALLLERPNQTFNEVSVQIEPTERRQSLLNGLSKSLRVNTRDETILGFSMPEWPKPLFFGVRQLPYESGYERVHPRDIRMVEGRVSLVTDGNKALIAYDLQAASLDKRVSIHWFYSRAAIAIRAESVPEGEFIRLIACAVGAKHVDSDDTHMLEFDPKEFRSRAVARLSADLERERIKSLRGMLAFSSAVYLHINDDLLAAAYETPESFVTFKVDVGTPIWFAGMEQLRAFVDVPPNHPPSDLASRLQIVELIDRSQPFEVTVRANGNVNVTFIGKDGKTRIHI